MNQGTVTNITPTKRNRDRLSVYLDGEFAFSLAADVINDHALRAGTHVTVEQSVGLLRDDARIRAKSDIGHLLSRRMRASANVRKKLKERGFDTDAVDTAIEWAMHVGLLDDRKFAEAFVRDGIALKRLGPYRLLEGLRRHGIPVELAKEVIDDQTGEGTFGRALEVGRKRWLRMTGIDEEKRRKRVYDYLVRRGFAFEHARDAIKELRKEYDQDKRGG